MKQKLRNLVLALAIAVTGSMVLVPTVAFADFKGDACQGVNALNGSSSSSCSSTAQSSINRIIRMVVQVLSVIVGFVAVIMIIVGGIKYITSGGDSGNISGAKNTILYALIGLVVVALAQILVHYVLTNTVKAVG